MLVRVQSLLEKSSVVLKKWHQQLSSLMKLTLLAAKGMTLRPAVKKKFKGLCLSFSTSWMALTLVAMLRLSWQPTGSRVLTQL
jgi:hypothetical protein